MESTSAEIGICERTRMDQTALGRYRRIYKVGSSGAKERALNSSVIRSSYLPFYSARSGAVSPFGANGKPIDAAAALCMWASDACSGNVLLSNAAFGV